MQICTGRPCSKRDMFLPTSVYIPPPASYGTLTGKISKMESFIRSKYESRRWALDSPRPEDPSVLEDDSTNSTQPYTLQPHPGPNHGSSEMSAKDSITTTYTPQPEPQHKLLSMTISNPNRSVSSNPQNVSAPSHVATQRHQPGVPSANNDLFDLDFRAPSVTSAPASDSSTATKTKDIKNDILSLFSATSPSASHTLAASAMGHPPWEISSNPQVQQGVNPMSMMGSTGIGQWGVNSGWTPQTTSSTQNKIWGSQPVLQSQATPQSLNTSNVWASGHEILGSPREKQDDVFGDLWGGYK